MRPTGSRHDQLVQVTRAYPRWVCCYKLLVTISPEVTYICRVTNSISGISKGPFVELRGRIAREDLALTQYSKKSVMHS